jgi:hypothetical protein
METFSSNLKGRAEQLGISNADVARRVDLAITFPEPGSPIARL